MRFAAASEKQKHITMATSHVRVAVRIRPLTPQEVGQGAIQVVEAVPPTVGIGERRFTYDSVFDSHVTQSDLYRSVSSPLLKSFLEGYNATIMAYGQTGSGKTFTMGSEAHSDGEMSVHPGLIPRFMFNLFGNLEQRKKESDSGASGQVLLEYRVTASFLEVYGEDVHDLLDKDRKTLPLREDANGGVVVQGLTSRSVSNADEALNVLHDGTMNRTTAATLMNLTSSRSHAVFTVHLQQTCRSSNGGDVDVTTTSCFTFVDLAGSERMKKTGAEGERAREGIKINEGLLALGNVINALADEERLVKEKKIHVPYRQSKLTRLLQDALGGNSQTLFLACVSPADSNASETLSTLHYANRARNIKNAPTKNIDATVVELQRLHALTHILQCELVKNRFDHANAWSKKSPDELGQVNENLMNQQEVKDYIESLHDAAEAYQGSLVPMKLQGACRSGTASAMGPFGSMKTPLRDRATATPSKNLGTMSVSRLQLDKFDDVLLDEVNPDEEMAILNQLLELQHRDNEYDKEHKSGEKELKKVEGELEEQEAMLLQIRESLKVYHQMKNKYEALMGEVQQLESEKTDLAEQLEKATADPSKGCSNAIKKKLEKVEISLARARTETRKHQQMYRKAEQEAQKSKALERKITELKHAKVSLMKKQKESAVRHREYTETKTREIMALKRKERTAGQKVSKLEAEINIHKNNLEKRKDFCDKLNGKLKQTESHLMKLLAMRKKELSHRTGIPSPYHKRKARAPPTNTRNPASAIDMFAPPSNETKSILFLLDKAVAAEVSKFQTKRRYEERVAEYSDVMRDMIAEVRLLNEARKKAQGSNECDLADEVRFREQNVEDLELKLELVGSELECLKANLPVIEEPSSKEGGESGGVLLENDESIVKMLGSVDAPKLRTVFWEMISKLTDSEVERQRLADTLQRKESTLQSFNNEVVTLNSKINTLTKEISQRRALSEAGNENFELIERLKKEKSALDENLRNAHRRAADMDQEVSDLRSLANKSNLEKNELREKLIVVEAIARQHSEASPVGVVLANLQGVWKVLGVTNNDREDAQRKIESSLEDTCTRIFDESLALKVSTIDEIDRLRKELTSMSAVLGKESPKAIDKGTESAALLPLCHSLRDEADRVRLVFKSAVDRRAKLANDARALLGAIGKDKGQPSSQLMDMIQLHSKYGHTIDTGSSTLSGRAQRAAVQRNVQDMVASLDRMIGTEPASDFDLETDRDAATSSLDNFDLGPPSSLTVSVLDSCEKEVSRLRLLKSELLVQNSELRHEAATLVKEMHLSTDDVVSLTEQVIQLQSEDDMNWWVKNVAQEAAKAVLDKDRPILTSALFSKHLSHIRVSMGTVANHRRLLSRALKEAVDRAQKTLLMTVDGEADASEAYASFHDALFQLPPLSKEHVEACITEMNALVIGVEAMTQSEVEALTVVWEALDIKTSQRSRFWSHLEQETTRMQSKAVNLFDDVERIDSGYREEWVNSAVKDAHKVHKELDMRLFKLEQIHREVEALRSKQDIKSRIISLDSEIRILSAKLEDFEDKKCGKNRLLTKKTGSGTLLKEERFRKQMQGKFTSKLEQLAGLLRTWIETEGDSFDANLLSDEVRRLLENADHMDSWVEKRTEFMHLNLNSKLAGKRSHNDTLLARSGSNESRSRSPVKNLRAEGISFEERPTKMARTGHATKPSPSPSLTSTTKTSRSAVNKRKPEGRSKSPTKTKMRRTEHDQRAKTTLLSPSCQQPNIQNSISMTVKRSTRSSNEAQKLMPFDHLLSETHSPQDKENAM